MTGSLRVGLVVGLCCAILAVGGFAQEGSAPRAPDSPEGLGLAARYPGDVGIEQHDAVVLAEGFEDDRLPERGFYDLKDWGKNLKITEEEHADGTHSLEVFYPKGSTGPWLRAPRLKGYETLYVRYYRNWEKDWDWGGPGDGNGHDGMIYLEPPGGPEHTYQEAHKLRIYLECASKVYGPWKRGFFGICISQKGQDPTLFESYKGFEAQGARVSGNEFRFPTVTGKRTPIVPGRWYCIETMVRMNTVGQADGAVKQWIDGVLTFDVDGIILRDGNNPELKVRQWWLGPYFHDGTTKNQSSFLDALVVATEYIGPIAPLTSVGAREQE